MPTVSLDIEFAICPICKEEFHEPKALPCLHTFCESCLQGIINRTQLEAERTLTGFPCPVCRTHTSPPDPNVGVGNWAKCFIANFLITQLIGKTKREQLLNIGCQPCSRAKRPCLAVFWCEDCQEAMCTECTDSHGLAFTLSSPHNSKPLSLLDLKKLSEQVSEDACRIHTNEVLRLFCESCNELLCSVCFRLQHRKCDMVVCVKDVVRAKKQECWKFKRSLEIKKLETETLIGKVLKNKENADLNRETIVRDLRSVRLAMEKLLEAKEKLAVEQVEKLHHERQMQLDGQLQKGKSLLNSLTISIEYFRSFAESTKHTDFLRIYPSIKATASKLRSVNIYSEQENVRLCFVPDSNFIYCFRKLQDSSLGEGMLLEAAEDQSLAAASFAALTTKSETDVITKWILTSPIEQSPSKVCRLPTKTVQKVGEFSAKIDQDVSCQIDDILILKDGNLLVTDWTNEKVKKFSTNGDFLDQLAVESWPCKVCNLTEDRVAITLPRTKEISDLCHTFPMKIRKIPTEKRYYGVTSLQEGFLACSTYSPPQIDILTKRAELIVSISSDILSQQLLLWPHYLTTTKSGDLLISDYCRKCLICVDVNTEKLKFVYKCNGDSSFSPGGVAVGNDGTIFVADTRQNRIYKFSEDGELTDLFLSFSTSNSKQMAITIDNAGTLFVSEEAPSDNVKVYQV